MWGLIYLTCMIWVCLNREMGTQHFHRQDLVDAKLERRKKGVFGPPMGRTCVVMVDDLNMPVKDTT